MTDDTPDSERVTINIAKGRYAAEVSPEDKEYAEQFTWGAAKRGLHIYPVRSVKGDNKIKVYLARDIMKRMIGRDLVRGETVRHKNKISLDCSRDNLILKGNK
jgi:hypothetical protein